MANFCDASNFSSGFLTGFWASFAELYILMILGAICIYGLVVYCIKGFGIYKMAQNRNFDNAYLAWLPFARYYLFGKISDDINRYKNVKSSNRVALLVLSILDSLSILALFVFLFVSICELLSAANSFSSSSDYWVKFFLDKANSFFTITTLIFIMKILFGIFYCVHANNIVKDYVPDISGIICVIIVLNLFLFGDGLVDSVIFCCISTNQPQSLKNSNQLIE